MIRAIAFGAGLALAWCGTVAAADLECAAVKAACLEALTQAAEISRPEDAIKFEIDDLQERVTQLEGLIKALLAFLPKCNGEPPERLPCIEKREAE